MIHQTAHKHFSWVPSVQVWILFSLLKEEQICVLVSCLYSKKQQGSEIRTLVPHLRVKPDQSIPHLRLTLMSAADEH